MSVLKYKTRGNSSLQGKPKVYFCCHPKDFDTYFESVSNEILEVQNCSVWYFEEDHVRDEAFFDDLAQMQLFVMPITYNLLCTENEALDKDFAFAVRNHIPVLPLMQESGLEALFNEKCGDLQMLDAHNTDATAIDYNEKLQKYLKSVLIGDELAEKIRAAFDAYVFLSYRKKDRKYAQELMRLIHKNDFCRNIAIWYDEFLTPGEDFNDSIKSALKNSDLFVLAVTPNLVNEPNYIMDTEYPLAVQEQKPILPAVLVPTDIDCLYEKYKDIPAPTDAHNEAELIDALSEAVKKTAVAATDSSPEHTFFIGLAYLGGVDVEVDYVHAVSLITRAAETGLPEAMSKLADMYRKGEAVEKNHEIAFDWHNRLITKRTEIYKSTRSDADCAALIDTVSDLGEAYENLHKYEDALKAYARCAELCAECLADSKATLTLLRKQSFIHLKLGHISKLLGDFNRAVNEFIKAHDFSAEIINTSDSDHDIMQLVRCMINLGAFSEEQYNYDNALAVYGDALLHLQRVKAANSAFYRRLSSWLYTKIGDIHTALENHEKALEYYRKAFALSRELADEYGTVTNKLNLAVMHNKIGTALLKTGEDCDATDEYLAAYDIISGIEDSQNPDVQRQLMVTSSHLAGINLQRKNFALAEELYLDVLSISKTLADSLETVESYRDLRVSCDHAASLYEKTGNKEKALSLRFFQLEAGQKVSKITHSPKDLIDLSACYNDLADLLQTLNQHEEALTQYLNAYRIHKALSDGTPQLMHALYYSCDSVAKTYIALKNLSEAKTYYREGAEICEKLVSASATVSNLDLLGTSYVNLASLESGSEQLEHLAKAISVYKQLCSASPENPRFRDDLEALKSAHEDLSRQNTKKKGFFRKLFGNNQ